MIADLWNIEACTGWRELNRKCNKYWIGVALDALMLNSTLALLRHNNDNLQYEIFLLTYTDRQTDNG